MTKQKREKIAYWFFLLLGIAGNVTLFYWFATKQMELTWWKIIIALSIFSVFMFKPTLFVEIFKTIIKKKVDAK